MKVESGCGLIFARAVFIIVDNRHFITGSE
jgi:hypothetical protein